MVRHAGAAPAPAVWKTAVLAVTPMTRKKMVAASGIAPDSPRLQRGANLSQLHSQMVPSRGIAPRSPAYQAGALLLSYEGEVVARRGYAPRSAECRSAALLLSYRANEDGARTR